jgi:hypothetical protein
MHPPAYLFVVRISAGWAACCQRCGATIAICASKLAADRHGADHTCITTSQEVTAR